MDIKDCVKKTIYIADEYYNKNNSQPYFDYLAENVMWYGTAIDHKIKGREKLRAVWAAFPDTPTFSLGDIEAQYIQTSPMSCEVMLIYIVTIHYPNGDTIPILQRTQFSWADVNITDDRKHRKHTSKIFMLHVSNPIEYHREDYIYPTHYNELYNSYEMAGKSMEDPRLNLRGTENEFYLITVSSIIWAESAPKRSCLIHLRGGVNKTIKVKTTITEIEKQTEGLLVRVHSGFIVNPLDVESVQRFKVSLSDGAIIPIPEKKYTAVKKRLLVVPAG
ncbi:MAG: LytTR family transcriptional regulator [Anaerolineaceae bacterium]|nr:LytTR family transcriptional regulator [Anaerolineaceae bacterium]